MPNTITPNMGLILPTPGQEPGPQYAIDQNQNGSITDGHNHSPGSGVQITPAGMNISTSLNFQNNSPYNVGSVIFSAPASNSNLTTLYTNAQSGGGITDLFYNDGAGNVIALTKAGAVNATIASIPGESYSGGTFTWVQGNGSTTPANFDIGSITIRPNTAGTSNGVVLGPPSGISSQYNLQLPIVPGSVSCFMQLDTSGNMSATIPVTGGLTTTNIASATILGSNIASATIAGSNIVAQTITQGLLAPRSTGVTVGAGGVAISLSSGSFSTSSLSFVPVTNLTVTITTTGRPVYLFLQGVQGGGLCLFSNSGGAYININNGATTLTSTELAISGGQAPGSINCLDVSVNGTPGTYTYQIAVSNISTGTININTIQLIAYEI